MIDTKNRPIQHILTGLFSLLLVLIFNQLFDVSLSSSFARTSFILLFFTLIIGPLIELKPGKISGSLKAPWFWRSEMGIWFAITGLIHFFIASEFLTDISSLISIGGDGYSLSNFLGLVALIWAVILALTSNKKAVLLLRRKHWKKLHSLTYVVFYLVVAHTIYFQFFSEFGVENLGRPDFFGYLTLFLTLIVLILQISSFLESLLKERSS